MYKRQEIEFQELEMQLSDKRIKEFSAKISHKNETFEELNTKIAEVKTHLKFKKEELENLVSETQKEEDFLIGKSKEFAQKIDTRLLASYQRIRTNSPTGLAVAVSYTHLDVYKRQPFTRSYFQG